MTSPTNRSTCLLRLPPDNTRAELAVPLMFGDEVLAVLDIQCDEPNCFTQSDRILFETLASTVAVSYRNASLYRTEKWRRQVAESFRDVAYQISNSVELAELLDHILERLENNLPCDISTIWLVNDQDANEFDQRAAPAFGRHSRVGFPSNEPGHRR